MYNGYYVIWSFEGEIRQTIFCSGNQRKDLQAAKDFARIGIKDNIPTIVISGTVVATHNIIGFCNHGLQ